MSDVMHSHQPFATQSEVPASNINESRDALVARWLAHFRVDYPTELDLGTLDAIRQCIENGIDPPSR